jgi:hypothetical protein
MRLYQVAEVFCKDQLLVVLQQMDGFPQGGFVKGD